MSNSIFCHPIDPHADKIDCNCVVIFNNSPFPNIISRPVHGFMKPYFVSPIKNLDLRTPLYYIPPTDESPELYLYEYYTTVINKIVQNNTDSGCVSPENFSDNSSCSSEDNSTFDTQIGTSEIGIQCNIEQELFRVSIFEKRKQFLAKKYFNIWKNRISYIKNKYFKLWFNNTKIKIQRKKDIRKIKKKEKKIRNKKLMISTIKQWTEISNYNKILKTKYFKLWLHNARVKKETKLKIINYWKKIIIKKKKLQYNYFQIWKLKVENIKLIKNNIILKWKHVLKSNLELKKKYFNIWKQNILNNKKKIINYDLRIVQILKFLSYDTFKSVMEKIPSLKKYIRHPELKVSFGFHLVYLELYCRKLIYISMKNLQEQYEKSKSKMPYNMDHFNINKNMKVFNHIFDTRIVEESIKNMYNCLKLKNIVKTQNIDALNFEEKQKFLEKHIFNDKDIKKDVYTIMLGESVLITKYVIKSKTTVNYYCSPLQYLGVIINETLKYFNNHRDITGKNYFEIKNNSLILNNISDYIFTAEYRDITQIIKEFIENNCLLKSFSKKDIFDYYHLDLCKVQSLLDIYRDSYITWISAVNLYYEYFEDWFQKNKSLNTLSKQFLIKESKDSNSPLYYKFNKSDLSKLEINMINRFEYQFNENNQDNITNSLGTIFSNINPLICENTKTYKLKVKGELRVVDFRSKFLNTLNFIKENKCKEKVKEKILHLRKTKLKKYKPTEYKDLILVEDFITQDYYICKNSDLIVCKSNTYL